MSYSKNITEKRSAQHAEILNLRTKLLPGEGASLTFPSSEARKAASELFYNTNKIERIIHYKLSILNPTTIWIQDLRTRGECYLPEVTFNPKEAASLLLKEFPPEDFSIVNDFLTKTNWFSKAALVAFRHEYFLLMEEADEQARKQSKAKAHQKMVEELFPYEEQAPMTPAEEQQWQKKSDEEWAENRRQAKAEKGALLEQAQALYPERFEEPRGKPPSTNSLNETLEKGRFAQGGKPSKRASSPKQSMKQILSEVAQRYPDKPRPKENPIANPFEAEED